MLTRLGPSVSVRRATGTFANTRLRKGAALHPAHHPNSADASSVLLPPDRMALKRVRGSYVSPCTANMALLPRKKISLLDFMMLRHTWASERFFFVEQDDGVYVVNPNDCAPSWMLDAALLQASAEGAPPPCGSAQPHASTREPVVPHGGADAKGAVGGPVAEQQQEVWDDVIPEAHLYHINDAFPWELPPQEDLASHAYWAGTFKTLWPLYQQDSGSEAANVALSVDGRVHQQGEVVQPVTQHRRVFLRVLRDINPGEELLMHYGTQWWAQYFLARLFVAADDAQVKHIRWIESLLAAAGSKGGTPFPLLKPCRMKRRGGGAAVVDLADIATRAAPTSSAVVASALRKSCQDASFFAMLLRDGFHCPAVSRSYPEFQPLSLTPIRDIRKTLLQSVVAQGGRAERLDGPNTTGTGTAVDGGPSADDNDGGLSL